jgi:hypothetical protein
MNIAAHKRRGRMRKLKKLVFITVSMLLLVITVPGCSSTVLREENSGSFTLHETPQTYVLIGEDIFATMPTVTLYENGNALLSQPPISSFGLFGTGHYQVSGDELCITYEENISTTFYVSDDGDTLTLKSSSLGFTKVGAVYKYRSKAEYTSKYSKIAGDALTLEIVRELAQKGHALTQADFKKYACVVIDSDYRIYDVEGNYTLTIIYDADGNTNYTIERNSSGESFPLNLNGSTGLVFDDYLGIESIPNYETQKWLDFLNGEEMPWGKSRELSLPEFPDVKFTWTPDKITAGDRDLIFGMPVWNVYLADLTNDGKPEICTTVSFGSGIVDTRVVVCDYVNDKEYALVDRMYYDYYLSMQDGKLMVTQTDYNRGKTLASAQLQLVNGEILRFGNLRPED